MSRILFAICLLLPFNVLSLGLGEHTVNSYLNQPLSLAIPLIDSEGLSAEQISVSLAEDFYYEQAGLEKTAVHSDLSFNVVNRAGKLFVDITSDQGIKEPYLNFITKLDMPNGRVLKEITVLLDPPAFDEPSAPAPITAPQTPSQQVAETPEPVIVQQERVVEQDVITPGPVTYAESTYYEDATVISDSITYNEPTYYVDPEPQPHSDTFYSSDIYGGGSITTARGDRLWDIAAQLSGGYNIQQTLVAIVQKNPHAFIGGNMNRLKANVTLDLPTIEEIEQVSLRQARRSYADDLADFTELRSTTLSSVVEEKPVESVVTGKGEVTLKTGEEGASEDGDLLTEDLNRAKSENTELKSRVAELNDILSAGEKSLTIQDQELASLQQKLKELNGGKVPENVKGQEAKVVQANTKPATDVKSVPQPKKVDTSLLDKLKPFALLLGLIPLLLAGLFFLLRRRNKETDNVSPFESDVNISDIVIDDIDTDAAIESLETGGSTIEDVDRLLSYSLEDKAAELLEDTIKKEPNREDYRLKLAQIYVDMQNKDDFIRVAAPLLESSDTGMRSRVGMMQTKLGIQADVVQNDVLADFESSADAIDVLADVESSTDAIEDAGVDLDTDLDVSIDLDLDTDLDLGADLDLDTDLDLGLDSDDLDLDIENAESILTEPSGVDSLDTIDAGVTLADSIADTVTQDNVVNDIGDLEFSLDSIEGIEVDSDSIDFELDDTLSDDEALSLDSSEDAGIELPMDFGSTDATLEMEVPIVSDDTSSIDISPPVDSIEVADGTAQDSASDELVELDNEFGFLDDLDENETKLDLANAYIEMGDAEEAKEILEEVLAEGDDAQKKRAQDLIEKC